MQKELLKVALIGVGSVGKKYARMITAGEVPHMKLSAVVIRRDELIEWGESLVNTDGDNARIFRSAEELFETGESCYDAVIIATPHKTHKELQCLWKQEKNLDLQLLLLKRKNIRIRKSAVHI